MNVDNSVLLGMEKNDLIEIITGLKCELTKKKHDFLKLINLRLYHLEQSHYMHLQYTTPHESFEVVGIPENIPSDQLEDEVIEIV